MLCTAARRRDFAPFGAQSPVPKGAAKSKILAFCGSFRLSPAVTRRAACVKLPARILFFYFCFTFQILLRKGRIRRVLFHFCWPKSDNRVPPILVGAAKNDSLEAPKPQRPITDFLTVFAPILGRQSNARRLKFHLPKCHASVPILSSLAAASLI